MATSLYLQAFRAFVAAKIIKNIRKPWQFFFGKKSLDSVAGQRVLAKNMQIKWILNLFCAATAQKFTQKPVTRSPLVNPEDARKEPGMVGWAVNSSRWVLRFLSLKLTANEIVLWVFGNWQPGYWFYWRCFALYQLGHKPPNTIRPLLLTPTLSKPARIFLGKICDRRSLLILAYNGRILAKSKQKERFSVGRWWLKPLYLGVILPMPCWI